MNTSSKGDRSEVARPFAGPALFLLITFVSALFLVSTNIAAHADQTTLAWNPSASPEITGYMLYYGTRSQNYSSSINVGNQTTGTITGLQDGVTYYAAVTAYDAQGAQSAYSGEINFSIQSGTVVAASPGSSASMSSDPAGGGSTAAAADAGGGGGGGCFIATAAFGSYVDPHVRILRSFRDTCLLSNAPGRSFVRWYYVVSPPIADAIRGSATLKAAVRLALIPLIGFGYLCLALGPGPAAFFAILSAVLFVWLGRKLLSSKAQPAP